MSRELPPLLKSKIPSGPQGAYEEALAFWLGRVNYEFQSPLPGDLKLDRMRALLAACGNPQDRLRIIHVAGSKGKGSTAAMLASILNRAGYRTGLFTSPHLTHPEERFQVDGQPIDREELTSLLFEIRSAVESDESRPASGGRRLLEGLTFFEIGTAAGFLHFLRRRATAAVIEVGLGGRFDSTNVCRPLVSVITSISFDHTQQLGNRLASIAREKAGIIKPGLPVVSGVVPSEARTVIEAACRERGAPLQELDRDFSFVHVPGVYAPRSSEHTPSTVSVRTRKRQWPAMELGLIGAHQAANAAGVVAVIETLRELGWSVGDDAVVRGLAEVNWPARLEVFGPKPFVVLDCAHNVASAEALVQSLWASFPSATRRLIFAGSKDKDVPGMFEAMAPHFEKAYFTRFQSNPRAIDPKQLAAWWRKLKGAECSLFESSSAALAAARAEAGPDDLICITGSVFLAGELRPRLVTGY